MYPKVSIIIPLYNSEKYIKDAIDSCINQTYKNLEIIVVDDGSTDDSKDVIEDYIKNNKIRYFYQSNKERSAARNVGLDIATGDYINFLDSDDLLKNTKIEKQVQFLERNKKYFATYSAVDYFDNATGRHISTSGFDYKSESIVDELVLGNFIPIQSVLFKKNSIRFDDAVNVAEDWGYFLNMFNGKKVYFMKDVLSSVRIEEHLSRNYILKMRYGKIKQLKKNLRVKKYKEMRFNIFRQLLKEYIKLYMLKLGFTKR